MLEVAIYTVVILTFGGLIGWAINEIRHGQIEIYLHDTEDENECND